MLSLEQVREKIACGEVKQVMIMLVDCEGRIKGKNVEADYFINSAFHHGKNI
jgi:hypothetical protein